ncbi:hybrid sensor histidine kinase/response regulator transcription factor [Belliella pelovolcani]|uniref:histidine kinase n=1 Tax=Belliella pelovolcani TaxID=529505 RepID=A0A1N7PII0_9BACT|nr:hybrid sensor histidine kinase/response regulator transcription factor [Belliella pelovolcani]SIT10346.1 Signal transduction histidine kinase [Belliella pelovolcani]
MKVIRLFAIALFFIFGAFNGTASGQPSANIEMKFDRIGVQQGLSQSSVLSIFQDSFGFLWIGTRDGLNKYDGYAFETYRHRANDITSLGGNTITEIQEDSKSNIWVITENGLSFFDRTSDGFLNYELPKDQFEFTLFNALLIDKKDQIWVGGRYGLFLFDPEKESFHRAGNSAFQLLGMVSSLASDEIGNIYVGASRTTLHKVDSNFKLSKVELETPKDFESRIESILVSQDSLWLGTYGDGLLLFSLEGKLLNQYNSQSNLDKRISNDNIRALLKDSDGAIWIGTFDGLNILYPNQQLIQVLPRVSDPKSLSHSSIRSLLKDRKGSIWIGTYQGGISLYDSNLQRFNHQYYKPGVSGSLSYDVVGSFATLNSGELLIGTERGGLNFYDGLTDLHQSYKPSGTIKSILVDQVQNIWLGVFREGLQLFNKETGNFKSYPSSFQSEFQFLKNAIINHMLLDADKGIWIGTDSGGGLFYFDLTDRLFKNSLGMEELQRFLRNYPVKFISVLDNSKILLSTKGKGLVIFDHKNGIFENIERIEIEGVNIQMDEINHAYLDHEGKVWLASNGEGIIKYDPNSQKFSRYHTGNGLSSDVVFGTVEDDFNNLWFICFNGISKLGKDHLETQFKNYNYSSGFPLTEMNEGAFLKIQTGEFLIGGINGYVRFNPITLKDNQFVPPITFTNLFVSNRKVSPEDETKILSTNIYQTKKITLTYFQSIFSIDFAALNFIRPENNQYKYQLIGFDQDWVNAGERRSVTYTSLPDGVYTFQVIGSNNDGVWNDIPASLEIVILPPPWKTWWAILIYALLILSGFWLIRRNAVKSIEMKNNLLFEQIEKEKWKEVHDLKLKYFIDVSHEFRTPLTLILSPLEEILSRGTGDSWLKSRLKIMFFNAKRLLHLIDQILEIREIETGHHQVNDKPIVLKAVLTEIIDSFKGLADKQKIRISDNVHELSERPIILDQDKIEKIIFNLLSNAFKFTPEGGEIELIVRENNGSFDIIIQDNGRGISEEALPKIFDRFFKEGKDQYGAGIGLSLTYSLVKVIGGDIKVRSKQGEGTAFTIEIPRKIYDQKELIQENVIPFVKPIPLEYQHTTLAGSLEERQKQKLTLLIVEDSVELRRFLKDQFKSEYDVITAKNGRSGFNKALKSDPAVIISDVMMPEMDGFELCNQIKNNESLNHIPVILLTAKNAQHHRIEGLEYGADDYISKPFNVQELKIKVKNLINNRVLIQKKFRGITETSDPHIQANSQDEQLMQKLSQLIDQNIGQPNLTVDFLGDKVGLSRVHLFRKVKALTGLTPSDLIKESRMKRAMKMLASGKYRVADVAFEVGFQDVAYFGKVFKKHFGHSPTNIKKDD